MITVAEVIELLVKRSSFLEDGLAQGIINISALARLIKPDVEREVMKEVTDGAVIMALNRLSSKLRSRVVEPRKIFKNPPDLMVRSGLFEITFINSRDLIRKRKDFLERLSPNPNLFITFTQGIYETTIIASRELQDQVVTSFKGERVVSMIEDLSSITVQLPEGTAEMPGAYNYILRAMAWEQINIVEVVSTLNEFTMILRDQDIDRAFFIVKRLF